MYSPTDTDDLTGIPVNILPLLKQAPPRLSHTLRRVFNGERVRSNTSKLQYPTWGVYPEIEAKPWHISPQYLCNNNDNNSNKTKMTDETLSRYPYVPILENAYHEILSELIQIRQEQERKSFDLIESSNYGGQWSAFYFYNQGRKNEENCMKCPFTTRVIENLPDVMADSAIGYVYFSVVAPGTHITPHCGPINTKLRCHLSLIVPRDADKCQMRVGDTAFPWKAGQCIVFDDSFEHEVWNKSDQERVVLLVDVWHPDLTAEEHQAFNILFSDEN